TFYFESQPKLIFGRCYFDKSALSFFWAATDDDIIVVVLIRRIKSMLMRMSGYDCRDFSLLEQVVKAFPNMKCTMPIVGMEKRDVSHHDGALSTLALLRRQYFLQPIPLFQAVRIVIYCIRIDFMAVWLVFATIQYDPESVPQGKCLVVFMCREIEIFLEISSKSASRLVIASHHHKWCLRCKKMRYRC